MKLTTKCHLKVLGETIELSLLAGIVALTADLGWLVHDIAQNGLTPSYTAVGIGLLGGIILTGVALQHHHSITVKAMLKELYVNKVYKKTIARLKHFKGK